MEIFINEYSLNGQYHEKEEFEDSLKIFISIFSFVNQEIKNTNKQIFGDLKVFVNYEAVKGSNFLGAYNKTNQQLKQKFLNSVFQRSGAKNWTSEQVHSCEDSFFYLSPSDIHDVSNTSIAEVTERTIQNPNKNYLLVNFTDSIFCGEDFKHPDVRECFLIPIVKNNAEDAPIKLDGLDNKSALENWLKEKQVLKDFGLKELLKDTKRFQKTSHNCQGQSIYSELLTKRYWYLDNLHKNHFEVFDSTGKNHLGEADLQGNIDEAKKDSNKMIDLS